MKSRERAAAKRATIGGPARRTLADITNLGNPNPVGSNGDFPNDPTNCFHHLINGFVPADVERRSLPFGGNISVLGQENSKLVKIIEERSKIIEISGNELGMLRTTVQKLQMQNWSLAQSNSQMLAELNSGKDKLKALQHELLCKEALLKVTEVESETKADASCQVGGPQEVEKVSRNCSGKEGSSTKPSDRCMRSLGRSKSMGPSTAIQQGEHEKVENKRRCLRKQSARFKPKEQEPREDLSDIEHVIVPVTKLPHDPHQEDGVVVLSGSSVAKEEASRQGLEGQGSHRLSLGRPTRKAADKVESYKEISLKVKLR